MNLHDVILAKAFGGSGGSGGSGGGASIDVTASVGQTIVVEEVDSNGKPTKWKAADLQDRTHWSETVEILPETTVEIDPDNSSTLLPYFPLVIGDTYTIMYNGVEYNSECIEIYGMQVIGNVPLIMETGDNGMPFLVSSACIEGECVSGIDIIDGSASVTLSITGVKTTPIPVEYVTNAFPYYIEVTGFGTTDDPYVCNDTVANVNAIYKSGRPVGACIIAADIEAGYTARQHLQLGQVIENTGAITYGFYYLEAYGPTKQPMLYSLWLTPKDDGTFEASITFG